MILFYNNVCVPFSVINVAFVLKQSVGKNKFACDEIIMIKIVGRKQSGREGVGRGGEQEGRDKYLGSNILLNDILIEPNPILLGISVYRLTFESY